MKGNNGIICKTIAMKASEAFLRTTEIFKLKTTTIARLSGVAPSTVSDFKHGRRDVQISTLQQITLGMPVEARTYFYTMLMQEQESKEAIAA
jgi:transcriptional regulator with XRE-family HTH domain